MIYTRATGLTISKAEILKNIDVRATNDPQMTFEADDFTVHPYGEMAVVNFRLIAHNVENGKPTIGLLSQHRDIHEAERQVAGRGLAGDEGAGDKQIAASN